MQHQIQPKQDKAFSGSSNRNHGDTSSRKNHPGQILVILILVLAIISIFLVIISSNVRRDSMERIQAEQYEKYYTAVEEELISVVTGESTRCDLSTNLSCEIDNFISDPGLNVDKLTISRNETNTIDSISLEKDKTFTLDLDGYTENITLTWTGNAVWVVNVDYQMDSGEYKTVKSVYQDSNFQLFPEPIDNCIDFDPVGGGQQGFSFDVDQCINSTEGGAAVYNTLAVRLKPLMANANEAVTMSISGVSPGFPIQVRDYVAIAEIEDDLLNTPTVILEVSIPINNPLLEIADYALRAEDVIEKDNP